MTRTRQTEARNPDAKPASRSERIDPPLDGHEWFVFPQSRLEDRTQPPSRPPDESLGLAGEKPDSTAQPNSGEARQARFRRLRRKLIAYVGEFVLIATALDWMAAAAGLSQSTERLLFLVVASLLAAANSIRTTAMSAIVIGVFALSLQPWATKTLVADVGDAPAWPTAPPVVTPPAFHADPDILIHAFGRVYGATTTGRLYVLGSHGRPELIGLASFRALTDLTACGNSLFVTYDGGTIERINPASGASLAGADYAFGGSPELICGSGWIIATRTGVLPVFAVYQANSLTSITGKLGLPLNPLEVIASRGWLILGDPSRNLVTNVSLRPPPGRQFPFLVPAVPKQLRFFRLHASDRRVYAQNRRGCAVEVAPDDLSKLGRPRQLTPSASEALIVGRASGFLAIDRSGGDVGLFPNGLHSTHRDFTTVDQGVGAAQAFEEGLAIVGTDERLRTYVKPDATGISDQRGVLSSFDSCTM